LRFALKIKKRKKPKMKLEICSHAHARVSAHMRARDEGSTTREIPFGDRCPEAIPETAW